MRLIDADKFNEFVSKLPKCKNGHSNVYDESSVLRFVENQPTAFDLESAIEKLKENEEDVIKSIGENSPSEFHVIKIKDLKELFEEYTQEQIDILKYAVNETNGKNGCGRMKTISEQIEELRETAELFDEIDDGRRILLQAADTIETLYSKSQAANADLKSVRHNGNWIYCCDRFPEQPIENLLFENKAIELYLIAISGSEYPFRAFWNGKFFTDGFSKLDNVMAWMPLPKLPKPHK